VGDTSALSRGSGRSQGGAGTTGGGEAGTSGWGASAVAIRLGEHSIPFNTE
jgi:hypothetical protein